MAEMYRWLAGLLWPAVLVWFLSGLGMLQATFPSLTEFEWFESAGVLDPESCCLSPDRIIDAVDRSQGIESLRIILSGGRPVVVAQYLDGSLGSAWVDTLEPVSPLPAARAQRAVEGMAPGRAILSIESIEDDVWTVHQRFNLRRPLWKVSVSGEEEPVRYSSGATGELVQDTTVHERRWNLAESVLHWWYVPWLRRQWALWDQLLWWVGGAVTLMMAVGTILLVRILIRQAGGGPSPEGGFSTGCRAWPVGRRLSPGWSADGSRWITGGYSPMAQFRRWIVSERWVDD